MIDRSSPTPYYEQLYSLLLEKIRQGELAEGDRLPGESELHRDYELSRATVRQALEVLESRGWARRVPHRGYFASRPSDGEGWHIESDQGFLDATIAHGNDRVRTDVLRATHDLLPEHATRALGLADGERGFVLTRLRYVDDRRVLFSTNFSPAVVAPVVSAAAQVLVGRSSLTEALREGGFVPTGARRVIHALPVAGEVAEHLHLEVGTPVLRIRSTTWDKSGTPYDYYETWLRSDVIPIELNTSTVRG